MQVQAQPSYLVMGHRKRLRSDLAQSLTGRIVRVVMEMAIFVAIFVLVAHLAVGFSNWLSTEMAEDPEHASGLIDRHSAGFRYLLYIGGFVVAALTLKFRFRSGK